MKNIREPVPVYKLPTSLARMDMPKEHPLKKSRGALMGTVVAMVALAAAGIAAWKFMPRDQNNPQAGSTPTSAPISAVPTPAVAQTPTPQSVKTAPAIAVTKAVDWKGSFGSIATIKMGDDPNLRAARAFPIQLEPGAGTAELILNDIQITRPNVSQGAAAGTPRDMGAIFTGTAMHLHFHFPDQKTRRLTVFAWDGSTGNAPAREQTLTLSNSKTNEQLATATMNDFRDGAHASFNVAGDVVLTVRREKGTSAVIQAIFIDPTP